MLRFLGDHYGSLAVAPWFGRFGLFVGVVSDCSLQRGVPHWSRIGVIYMMAQDGEMPKQLARQSSRRPAHSALCRVGYSDPCPRGDAEI
jgi:hypothetical protein